MKKTLLLRALFVCIIFLSLDAYSQTVTPFALRYSKSAKGSIDFVSNAILQCDGTGGGGADCGNLETQLPPTFEDWSQNNDHVAEYIDIDLDATTFSSSSDSLDLASCSNVVFAGIYWGGRSDDLDLEYLNRGDIRIKANADGYVDVSADVLIDAGAAEGLGNRVYYCFADITALIQDNPSQSLYTVADVYCRTGGGSNRWGGWNIVVVYENDLLPMRSLNVFDGLVNVNNSGTEVEVGISGFLTPPGGPVSFEVGVFGYDGDRGFIGDSLLFDGGSGYVAIFDALNPQDDIFNFSQSTAGSVSTSQNPLKHNNISIDADIFEPDNSTFAYIGNSATAANVKVTTSNETVQLQVITLAIDIHEPDIRAGVRVEDLNGGALEPGDTLKYTVVGSNIGSDPSIDSYLVDTLDRNIEYVPESIEITFGPNSGLKTDATGDDQAFYNAADNYIRVNIGDFADDAMGGEVENSPSGIDSTVFTFLAVAIEDCAYLACDNIVDNQAFIFGIGEFSGNVLSNESKPGTIDVDGCPVMGATTIVIDIMDCETLSDTIVAGYCEGVVFADFPYDELGYDYFDDVYGPVTEADSDGIYYAIRVLFDGCEDTIGITITEFFGEPTAANAGTDQGVCIDPAVAILEGNDPLVGTGLWTVITGGATITSPSAFNSGVTGLTLGVNTFRWTVTNGDCIESFDDVIITTTIDSDDDGVCDVDDEDDDNDGIPDAEELDCAPAGFIPFNTPGYGLDTDFNADITDAGAIENIIEYANLTAPSPTNVDFNFSVVGTAEWTDGVELRNTGALSPDGIHINVQAQNTDFPNGDVAIYELVFSQPVYNLEFKYGGLDNLDATSFEAFNGVEVIELNADNIFNETVPGPDYTLVGNTVISTAGVANAPDNAVRIEIAGPVTSILLRTGKNDGSASTATTQLYEMTYCTGYDPDGDGVANHFDLDSDNDGVADILEAGGSDTDGDGVLDDLTDTDGDGLPDLIDADDGGTPLANPDSDGDGLLDVLDLDSDNDGFPDVVEAGGVDTDGDGLIDGFADIDGDGFADAVDTDDNTIPGPGDGGFAFDHPDSDYDGVDDRVDLDSDNDGTPDIIEGGGDDTDGDGRADDDTDTDGDGFPDLFDTDDGGVALEDPDTDDDDLQDHLDLDSDNDGIPDVIENGGTDADGDGVIDGFTDVDGDGFADAVDSDDDNVVGTGDGGTPLDVGDADLDGIPNYLDLDSDNDGILDLIEAGGTDDDGNGKMDDFEDIDEDGFEDSVDSDDNTLPGTGDGGTALDLPNTDGAGGVNFLDIDSDDDGIPDNLEGQLSNDYNATIGADSDGDGVDDAYDIDSGGASIEPEDTDADGDADYVDLDSDNDGEPDLIEGHDLGGDGTPDIIPLGTDSDNDGLDDAFDTVVLTDLTTFTNAGNGTIDPLTDGVLADADVPGLGDLDFRENDSDGDGIDDSVDLDDDNDGIPDLEEGDVDTDGDGVLDRIDLDSDNDGIPDIIEAGGTDIDGDGRLDAFADTDEDGLGDEVDTDDGGTALANPDSDGDGVLDVHDLDSDNDGTPDVTEAGGTDVDGDGVIDAYADADGDGFADEVDTTEGGTSLDNSDTDSDGFDNRIDLDSDNDGIPDITEVGGTDVGGDGKVDDALDTDGDGLADVVDPDDGGTPLNNPDSDLDGIPDGIDLDSDNDGILDITEGGGTDTDGDGQIDAATDTDMDGLADVVDPDDAGIPLANPDTDGDGFTNATDIDADGDGIPDNVEGQSSGLYAAAIGTDTDGDGIDDAYDIDEAGTPIGNYDHDADGDADYVDLDSDNDGEPDLIEGHDLGGDGTPDIIPLGTDSDNDGLDDAFDTVVLTDLTTFTNAGNGTIDPLTDGVLADADVPGLGDLDFRENDTDGDGVEETIDLDDDNDGVPDLEEGDGDTDGDGVLDRIDLDSDNDGIPDIIEAGGTDIDGDGRLDAFADTDGDGLGDEVDVDDGGTALANPDSDGDGIIDIQDLDSDNDGIADVIEAGGTDVDGDGVIDDFIDADNDGFTDEVDTTEGGTSLDNSDTDSDGFDNRIDLDSDNDGIPDITEVGGTDADGDGKVDDATDTDGDGLADIVDTDDGGTPHNNPDSDLNGIPDAIDLDSDNDGILDIAEAGGTDTDDDGKLDVATDSDMDGLADLVDPDDGGAPFENPDTDGDGFANAIDIDADGDGIPDNLEGQSSADYTAALGSDTDGDGIVDAYDVDEGGIPIGDNDHDIDDIPDYIDLDSDNDGEGDIIEGHDMAGDGTPDIIPSGTDSDNDGLDDAFDTVVLTDLTAFTNAGNGTIDPLTDGVFADADAPGTGNLDFSENDTDDDGIDDAVDLDDDNDGIPDLEEGVADTDGDGIPDRIDLDSDNDGVPDVIEAGGTDADGDGRIDGFVDSDSDGLADEVDTDDGGTPLDNPDSDGDGIVDTQDLDSDNDGTPDIIEVGGTDVNGDGIVDDLLDTDTDGLVDIVDTDDNTVPGPEDGGTAFENPDTDSEGIHDRVDLDSDNDGIPDVSENGGTDIDGDGIIDGYTDVDGDGFADAVDSDDNTIPGPGDGGIPLPRDDMDIDGIPNSLDSDSDNDGMLDNAEAGGTDDDGSFSDVDGDGFDDAYDTDDNTVPGAGDGGTSLPMPNTDETGGLDYLDIDADDDGIVDNLEGQPSDDYTIPSGADADGDGIDDAYDIDSGEPIDPEDTDGDGVPDYKDLDSDNDGESDLLEGHDTNGDGVAETVPSGTDSDGDGLDDAFDTVVLTDATSFTNAANGTIDPLTDGVIADADVPGAGDLDFRETDYDNDGVPDIVDLDDDNDGIPDLVEDLDTDADGDPTTNQSDSDQDGIPDMFDLDSDNDGIADIVEAGGTDDNGDGQVDDLNEEGMLLNDTDEDGLDDLYDANNGGEAIPNPDTDGDGNPDFQDLDSDNDGIYDRVEDGGIDEDNDGHVDDWADEDGDSIPDYADVDQTAGADLDLDGIDDAVQVGVDQDGDGIADDFDEDANGDGWDDDDATDGSEDTDGDGVEDRLDLDSDNDGTPDILEDGGIDADGDGRIDDFNDEDEDGADDDDMTDGLDDFDEDGVPDHEDLDSDNDGITDAEENGIPDEDGDGVIDDFNDADGDGWDDDDQTTVPVDTDGDGAPDHTDLDSDNDEVLDETENDPDGDGEGPDDTDGDGISDFQDVDDDNDGRLTIDEGDEDGDGVYDDCDYDGTPDYLDPDPCGLIVPSGFSPDGDGINDFFVIQGIQAYPDASLKIINRWGNRVYEITGGYSNDWDGTNQFGMTTQSRELPVGTYFYILDLGDGSEVIKGYVFINK